MFAGIPFSPRPFSVLFGVLLIGLACRDDRPPPVPGFTPDQLQPEEITALDLECESGDAYGCFRLAAFLAHTGEDPREATRAMELAETACGRGLLLACHQTAHFFETGVGVYPDPRRAFFRYGSSCKKFHLGACFAQARLLDEGQGVEADPERARRLLERTCHHQTLNNCRDIAREVHVRERRISRRQSEFHLCTVGWNLSCHRLGELYSGDSPERGAQMFERACSRGHEPACLRLEANDAAPR